MHRAEFVHLNVHSHYSLLDATCRIDDLVQAASDLKYRALALTDSGNLFGAIEFYKKARSKGVKPIIGTELYVTDGPRTAREKGHEIHNLTVLVKDLRGYKNLIRLVSIGYVEGFYYKPRVDQECLELYREGLIILSGNRFGKINRLLWKGRFDEAVSTAKQYRDLFEGEFYLEIQNQGLDEQRVLATQWRKLAQEAGIGMVATNEVRYLHREDAFALEVARCISIGKVAPSLDSLRPETDQNFLKSPAEMKTIFSEFPEAIETTVAIADKCNLELDFSRYHLPQFEIPDGSEDHAYLEALCREGTKRRYAEWTPEAEERLIFELDVIKKMGFSSYFLITWDFIDYAKKRGIPVGPGRGSAAGSMVAYLLGITDLCPLKYGLFFERFLNPGRVSMPDIDIDFCERRRSEVIHYVRDKYGRDNVCQIITFGVLKPKAALKDVSRVLGISFNDANKISQAVPSDLGITLQEALETSKELQEYKHQHPALFQIAESLEGCVRHSSTHAAGVVITPDKLWTLIPIAQRDDEITTQFTMKWLEMAGILKMDFLGLSTLTIIDGAVENIARNRGQKLDITRIPLDDKRTFKLLASGNTSGVFTFETSSFKDLLKRLKPSRFEDLVAAQALGRPGPIKSGMVDEYIEAKHGLREIKYPHPKLEDLLKETNGVFIYQEQVMQTANLLAGYQLAEADGLRKAMGKKIAAEMEKHRELFTKGAIKNKIDPTVAEDIFNLMEKFAAYGFNKAHSACYALVSYRTAFLKANFTPEFMASLLTVVMDVTDKVAHLIEECERLKIKVLPPDVNESNTGFTVQGKQIRFGLGAIKGMGENVANAILSARTRHGAFTTLEEFCKTVDTKTVNRRAIESLIKCGAFDSFTANRAQLLSVVDQAMQLGQETQRHQVAGQGTLMDFFNQQNIEFETQQITYPDIPDFSEREILNFEKETLGLYLSGHPLLQHQLMIDRLNTIAVAQIEEIDADSQFMVAGIIKSVRKIRVKATKRDMAILMLEDMRSSLEIPIFSEIAENFRDQIIEDHLVLIWGKITRKRGGEKRPVVEGIAPLENLMTNRNFRCKVTLKSPESRITRDQTAQIRNVILANSGRHTVFWRIISDIAVVTTKLGKAYKVTPSRNFVEAIEKILGENSVRISLELPQAAGEKRGAEASKSRSDDEVTVPLTATDSST